MFFYFKIKSQEGYDLFAISKISKTAKTDKLAWNFL